MKKTPTYGKFIVYLAAVVLVNLVAATLFFRFDLTSARVYSLSNVSREVVGSLREPLTINVFFTRNLPAPYNTVEQYLKDLLGEYALHANTYFNYRFYDVSAEEEIGAEGTGENRKLASGYGINPVQIQVVEKDEVKFKKAYMGLVIIHGDMVERIPTITTTDGLEYKLTTSIQRLNNKISALAGLKGKVQVKLFLSTSLMNVAPHMDIKDLPKVADDVKKAVETLNGRMYGKLEYTFSDPQTDAEMSELTEKYNLMMLKWPALEDGKIPAGSGIIGLVTEYGDKTYMIPVLQAYTIPLFGTQYKLTGMDILQEAIEQSIDSLIGINETLAYLSDKGTINLYGPPGSPVSLNNFNALSSRTYSLKDMALSKGIPEGTGCLLIVRPTEMFCDYDLYQIDQALMRGTNLAIFLDPFVEAGQPGSPMQQQGQLVPVDTGLDKLLKHYGIDVSRSLAMDEKSYKQRMPEQYGGGEQAIYYAPLIDGPQINNAPAYMKNIKELITFKIAPIIIDEARIRENKLKATVLFTTSDKSWEMKDRLVLNPMFIKPPADPSLMAKRPLACMVEGSFPSYFKGKPMPERPSGDAGSTAGTAEKAPAPQDTGMLEHKGGSLSSSKPARIFLIGSSEMISDNLISEQGDNPNATFIMNIIDALNGREDIALMRSKVQSFNPLLVSDEGVKALAKVFNVAGLPVVVVIFGLFVWLRRHSRKKRIEAAFGERGEV
ncbi:MAG TPA: Gldg family protein [Deltaproteobacteria bacterium]|nr:Gldg family protein [Deltaproteobacteria bacterium]